MPKHLDRPQWNDGTWKDEAVITLNEEINQNPNFYAPETNPDAYYCWVTVNGQPQWLDIGLNYNETTGKWEISD